VVLPVVFRCLLVSATGPVPVSVSAPRT
jgi:hypothetical protein